jgi:plastocyanin domain-containing protein
MGCGDTLVFREAGINDRLKEGVNVFSFTPRRAGRFPFSCSMGMFRGTMVVEPGA